MSINQLVESNGVGGDAGWSALIGRLVLCPLCGGSVQCRLDRKGHPFFRCAFCASSVFIKSTAALVGYLLCSEHANQDAEGWRRRILSGQAQLVPRAPSVVASEPSPQPHSVQVPLQGPAPVQHAATSALQR